MVRPRKGIALIELIIAIIIMAIAMSSVPFMVESASKADSTTLQQEAVLLASSQMSMITRLHWDEQQTNARLGYPKILDVVNNSDGVSATAYARYSGTTYRIGGYTMNAPHGQGRRKFYSTVTNASTALGPDAGETDQSTYDDIDDYNGYTYQLTRSDAATDYKYDYTIATVVNYVANTSDFIAMPGTTTSVKWVTVSVSNSNGTDVNLSAFMSNIGETKLLSRPLL